MDSGAGADAGTWPTDGAGSASVIDLAQARTAAARESDSYLALSVRYRVAKRALDVLVVVTLLPLLVPILVLIAVAISLDSRGPVFFRQVRVGAYRVPFEIWKFRKMRHDLPRQGPMLTLRHDLRLTRLGRLLERTKLDEVPQVINVLKGEMSLVGPRPEVPKFVELYPDLWNEVLSVKPGIFGVTQNRFRNESDLYPDGHDVEGFYERIFLPRMLALDASYARHPSIVRDIVLLVEGIVVSVFGTVTLKAMLARRGQLTSLFTLSLLALGAMGAAHVVTGHALGDDNARRGILVAGVAGLVCTLFTGVASSGVMSLVADDVRRLFVCTLASTGAVYISLRVLQTEDVDVALVIVDGLLFLTAIAAYRLFRYQYAVALSDRTDSAVRYAVTASLAAAPACAALAVTLRHGIGVWAGDDAAMYAGMASTLLVLQPLVLVFRGRPDPGSPRSLRHEVASTVGAALAAAAIALLAVGAADGKALPLSDLAAAAGLFIAVMVVLDTRHAARVGSRPSEVRAPALRLVVVGSGASLAGYLAAIDAIPGARWTVAGVADVSPAAASRVLAGHRVVWGVARLAELLDATPVDVVVLLPESLGEHEITSIHRTVAARGLGLFEVRLVPGDVEGGRRGGSISGDAPPPFTTRPGSVHA